MVPVNSYKYWSKTGPYIVKQSSSKEYRFVERKCDKPGLAEVRES